MNIKRLFFDVYRWDTKQLHGYHQTQVIRCDNSAAHDDDAVGDAFLFVCDKQTDRTLYRELYGLEADQVLRFRTHSNFPPSMSRQILIAHLDESKNDKRLPVVFNAHANLVIRGRPLSEDIKEAVQQFLIPVEELMEDNSNYSLDAAYFRFWQHYSKDLQ